MSPATVRNDMAALEEEGLIAQPHTSAGRIPTDKGYRLFVDRLTTIKPMSPAERRAIATFLDGAVDLDDVVHRSVRLLAQLTQQVADRAVPHAGAVDGAPRRGRRADPTRLLLVLILAPAGSSSGWSSCHAPMSETGLADLRARLRTSRDRSAARRSPPSAPVRLAATFHPEDAPPSPIVAALVEADVRRARRRAVVVGGTANLARFGDGFEHSIKPLVEALEEHVVLLKLLGEAASPSTVTVRIGHEGPAPGARRGVGRRHRLRSREPGARRALGIVGPTRMDYPGSMAAVHAVARYVGQILADA